jgi:hypothetical protein
MAVRHPPQRNVPPVSRRGRAPRVVRYVEPEAGFFRRWGRRIFRPPVVIALVLLTTFTVGVLGYYYHVFSQRVDKLIRGDLHRAAAVEGRREFINRRSHRAAQARRLRREVAAG